MLISEKQEKKNQKLRNAEYYDMTTTFDKLYAKSKSGAIFNNLIPLISSDENIKLAYRNIKRNHGSTTEGTDNLNIKDLEKIPESKFIELVKKKITWYKPKPVKRVLIPKENGKLRPLGIPAIWDRIVQQCILQILEPICEAKFCNNSYGFRPALSAEHALSRCYRLIQRQNMQYVVDIDIEGFFDNVNHTKLKQQMWHMGIRDKKLLCIISAMLKAPVITPEKQTIYPEKGTPQGGILSPLLSNIVLNELDWWVLSQWEDINAHFQRPCYKNDRGTPNQKNLYMSFRKSNLKKGTARNRQTGTNKK